jgi:hypothetical protein
LQYRLNANVGTRATTLTPFVAARSSAPAPSWNLSGTNKLESQFGDAAGGSGAANSTRHRRFGGG